MDHRKRSTRPCLRRGDSQQRADDKDFIRHDVSTWICITNRETPPTGRLSTCPHRMVFWGAS